MSREKLSYKKFMRFDEVWVRIISSTTIKKNKELALIVGIAESVISVRKKENKFPVEWGFFIAQEFDLSTDWLLTGQGEKKNEKKDFLGEVQEWMDESCKTNTDMMVWFKVQFENKFPEFIEWKKRKEEQQMQDNTTGNSKVA